jgi:hypothetical protein
LLVTGSEFNDKLARLDLAAEDYCGNSVDWASGITGGGFHFPVTASLCGA